ncbi:MAG: Dabb family protein [Gammaproteobacteria bacterium]|nr:MAG: Dabb family protein [Gammaproteobacteria bacterium]
MIIALLLAMVLSLPALANGDGGSIEHVVVVWLKTPGDRAAQDKVIAASQVLKSIPGVLSLKAGTMIPSERPIVDSSFDIALSVTFSDLEAMQNYLTHPTHVQLVGETLEPLVDKIRVYDYRY